MNIWQKTKKYLQWLCTPTAKKQAYLDNIIFQARQVPETAMLLDMAKENGIAVRFDSKMIFSSTAGVFTTYPENNVREITINPSVAQEDWKAQTVLSHELRHMYQAMTRGETPQTNDYTTYTPLTCLLIDRIKEADAAAYSAFHVERFLAVGNALCEVAQEKRTLQLSLDDLPALQKAVREKLEKMQSAEEIIGIMSREFFDTLDILGNYDRKTMRRAHAFNTSAAAPERSHKLIAQSAAEIARSIRADVYLNLADETVFKESILKGVKPEVQEAISLIDAFTAANDDQPEQKKTLRQKARDLVYRHR